MMISRRQFLIQSSFAAGVVAAGSQLSWAAPKSSMTSDIGCGRATGYAEANKIITHDGKTHVAWIDSPPEGFRVRARTLDNDSGEWSPTYTVGEGYDNHGGPALTIDSEGYLHIAYYPHHHPMRYRKSLRPNDVSEWGEEEAIGTTCTYPTLVCAPDDTLILTCRESNREKPWVCNCYIKKPGGAWEGPHTIITALHNNYAHFMEALAWDKEGTLHLGCRIYGGDPRRGHTIGYMKSNDVGETWKRWDGTDIPMPANAETIDIVNQSLEGDGVGLRAGCIAIDPHGTPHIIGSRFDSLPATAWISSPGPDGRWHDHMLRPHLPKAYAEWGIATPGGLTFSDNGKMYVVATIIAPPDTVDKTIWGHASSEPVLFVSKDNGETYESHMLTTPDADHARWLPNIERQTGHNKVSGAPAILYTEGGPGDNNKQLVANRVHYIRPEV